MAGWGPGFDEVACIRAVKMPTNGSRALSCGNLFERILGLVISLLDISWIHRLSWDKLLQCGFLGHSLSFIFEKVANDKQENSHCA